MPVLVPAASRLCLRLWPRWQVCHQLAMDHGPIPERWCCTRGDDGAAVRSGQPLNKPEPLFRKISEEEVARHRAAFSGGSQNK